MEIDLDVTTTPGQNCARYIETRLVCGMSFSMVNGFEDYEYTGAQDGLEVITVSKFTVDEVTVTPIPAFAASNIGQRGPEDPANQPSPPAGGMSRLQASMKLRQARLSLLGTHY